MLPPSTGSSAVVIVCDRRDLRWFPLLRWGEEGAKGYEWKC